MKQGALQDPFLQRAHLCFFYPDKLFYSITSME